MVAGYLPWFFFQARTVFTFYAIVFEPFMILALVFCAKLLLDSSLNSGISQALVAAFVTIIFLNFVYFLPIFTGEVITYDAWLQRMWLSSWI
jgi:dolichyl-phosphate-mannose--protein O-mannosyl transferase